ncbi:MAG: sugar ABC transporter substrate-binding protein, partial [Epulopiscium sp.]|nr:sugar ABC transporter substrate-binding protein [Candidatus Epulonipiscium sp.]
TKAVYYLTRDEALEKLMENVGINPAKTELSAKYYEANPEFKAVESMTPYAKDFGYPADTKRFIDLLIDELELKVLGGGEQSAQEILDKIQTQFK